MKDDPKLKLTLLINFFVAANMPVVINLIDNQFFTFPQELLFGIGIMIGLTVVEAFAILSKIAKKEEQEFEVWKIRNSVDVLLQEIRAGFYELSRGKKVSADLFSNYYENEIKELSRKISGTVSGEEIVLDKYHIDTTDALLEGFNSREKDIFRATNEAWNPDPFFEVTYREYLYNFSTMVSSGKIKEVRRLFLYKSKHDFESNRMKKLVAFHNNNNQLNAKFIDRKDFLKMLRDFGLKDGVEDFGIYSDRYIYLAKKANTEEITGAFSSNKNLIETYMKMFDKCWDSPLSEPSTVITEKVATYDQLFDDDFVLISEEVEGSK